MQQDPIQKHSTAQSILLHLFPGILVGGFYFLARQPVARLGYPSVFAQMLAFALVLFHSNLDFCSSRARKRRAVLACEASSAIAIQSLVAVRSLAYPDFCRGGRHIYSIQTG